MSAHPTPVSPAPIAAAAAILSRGYRSMLGLDGTSVEDAARAAFTPSGPPVEELEARIRARRAGAAAPAGQVAA